MAPDDVGSESIDEALRRLHAALDAYERACVKLDEVAATFRHRLQALAAAGDPPVLDLREQPVELDVRDHGGGH